MDELLERLYLEIANNDENCFNFIVACNQYFHDIDDIVDEDKTGILIRMKTYADANNIFSSIYYQTYSGILNPVIQMITSKYHLSVEYENGTIDWQKDEANFLRSCGNDLLLVVAAIQHAGDYNKLFNISRKLSELSYTTQRKVGE